MLSAITGVFSCFRRSGRGGDSYDQMVDMAPVLQITVRPGAQLDALLPPNQRWEDVGSVRVVMDSSAGTAYDPWLNLDYWVQRKRPRMSDEELEAPSRDFAQLVADVLHHTRRSVRTVVLQVETQNRSLRPHAFAAMFDALRKLPRWTRAGYRGTNHAFGGFFLSCGAATLEEIALDLEPGDDVGNAPLDRAQCEWLRRDWTEPFVRLRTLNARHTVFLHGLDLFFPPAGLPVLDAVLVQFDGGYTRNEWEWKRVHAYFMRDLAACCPRGGIVLELRDVPAAHDTETVPETDVGRLVRELRIPYDAYPYALEHLARTQMRRVERLVLMPQVIDHGVIGEIVRNNILSLAASGLKQVVFVEPPAPFRIFEHPSVKAPLEYLNLELERSGVAMSLVRAWEPAASMWELDVFDCRPAPAPSALPAGTGTSSLTQRNPWDYREYSAYEGIGEWQGEPQAGGMLFRPQTGW